MPTQPLPEGPWIPFVGSGISIASGLPSAWGVGDTLLTALTTRLKPRLAPVMAKDMRDIRMEILLQEAHDAAEAKSLIADGSPVFSPWHEAKPNAYHQFLADHLRTAKHPFLLTTNIDCLIERAWREGRTGPLKQRRRLRVCASPRGFKAFDFEKWSQRPHPVLFKLHGSLCDAKGTPSLNTIQMAIRQIAQHAGLRDKERIIKELSGRCPLVFMGYSGRDDFDLFPLLLALRSRKHPWVWLEDLRPGSTREILAPSRTVLDPVAALLSANPDVAPLTKPSRRILGPTEKALGIEEVVPTDEGKRTEAKAKLALSNWTKGISKIAAVRLLTALLCHKRYYAKARALIESSSHKIKEDPDLILTYMRVVKDSHSVRGEAIDLLAKAHRRIQKKGHVTPAQRSAADSFLGFALRDKQEHLAAAEHLYRAANRAKKTLPLGAPARLRAIRDQIFGGRSLWIAWQNRHLNVYPFSCAGRTFNNTAEVESFVVGFSKRAPKNKRDLFNRLIKQVDKELRRFSSKTPVVNEEWEYEVAKAQLDVGMLLKDLEELPKAAARMKLGREAATRCGNAFLTAQADADRVWVLWDAGELREAMAVIDQARWLINGLEDHYRRIGAHRTAGFLLNYSGRRVEAEEEFSSAFRLLEGRGTVRDRRELIETYFARGESRLKGCGAVVDGITDLVAGCRMLREFKGRSIERIRVELWEARKRFFHLIPPNLRTQVNGVLNETAD